MKRFRERNQTIVGLITGGILLAAALLAINVSKLPLINNDVAYHADFANAAGLESGDLVTIAGVKVGTISGLSLRGDRVRVTFKVAGGTKLGSTTEAVGKVLTPVGQEYMELVPSGGGRLEAGGVIPTSRTHIPATLISNLYQLTQQTEQINLPQLVQALNTTTATLQGTPSSATAAALSGLARFSQILADRQQQLATLVNDGAQLTGVLSQRSGELVDLIGQSDLVLKVLDQRRQAIKALLDSTSSLSQQLTSLLANNRPQLTALLANLQTVSAVLAKDDTTIGNALPLLAAFDRYTANATGSGPFADLAVPTMLIPDNVIAQCGAKAPFDPTFGCRP
ncbi:MAG: MCE family protein [Acidimicrobiales bacterium]